MAQKLIRQAMVALQRASEARTVEFQARLADEARRAFEQALRSARARFEDAESKPTAAARAIARHAVAFDLDELEELGARLAGIEGRIAEAIEGRVDPRDYRRLRLAE